MAMTVKPQERWMDYNYFIDAAIEWNKEHPEDQIDVSGMTKIYTTSEEDHDAIQRFYEFFGITKLR